MYGSFSGGGLIGGTGLGLVYWRAVKGMIWVLGVSPSSLRLGNGC